MIAPAALLPGAFDAHDSLRSATHATHMRLHGLDQFRAIAEGRLGRAQYAGLLSSLHAFHSVIARAAEAHGLLKLSSSPRRRSLLEADLASLDVAPAGERLAWTAPSREVVYGALYIAEGSALGGRVIARQLDYLFGEGDKGRSFFCGDRGTGSRWRGFLAALAQDCDDTALPQMIAGAETGFALFERCLAT